uniref:Ribonuclease Z n=1 Tax=Caloglossa intermedia TaxID=100879 RepID=A0A1Z1M698_9FLOR|nr:ribonuclease Z [Caloglossa intermedia]ARW61371.1 ribonuclease Z [Caloglossa intermedia]
MKLYCLSSNIKVLKCYDSNLMIHFSFLKSVLLFNCCESCQYLIINNNHKINNISIIILTDMHISNLSGLVGLLSSLNLLGRIKSLHIYGPKDLANYLELNKKYSHTNFCYVIYIHILTPGLVISNHNYKIYSLGYNYEHNFLIIEKEKTGAFLASKALSNGLVPNSLYSRLKKGLIFLLPDGCLLSGNSFTCYNLHGSQVSFVSDRYYRRKNLETLSGSEAIFF